MARSMKSFQLITSKISNVQNYATSETKKKKKKKK